MNVASNRRILLIDDMPSIHEDFRKVLAAGATTDSMADIETALFGSIERPHAADFELDSAHQGREGVEMVAQAKQTNRPYAMAFVDMRMPPGWDGVETIEHLWQADGRVQVVICTAYSDHSLDDVLGRLETADRLLVLKKPFDMIEVRQLANALTAKWETSRQAALKMADLETAVQERTQSLKSEVEARRLVQEALQSANNSLLESEERYRLLVELSPDAILIESSDRIVFANRTAKNLFRAEKVDELFGHSMATLMAPTASSQTAPSTGKEQHLADSHILTEEMARCLDGSEIDVMVSRLVFSYQGQAAVQFVVRDVSEHKRIENQLQYQAHHDALTGLPNRHLLMDRLQQAIANAQRNEGRLSVCFIDLDRFKWINDNLGHAAGDELLKTVAMRMKGYLRETDTVARLGGDEFVLLLCGQGPVHGNELVLQRIVANVAQPIVLAGREVSVSCSAGCSNYPDDGIEGDELLKFADAAMYRAKELGRNNLQIYNEALNVLHEERLRLENDLKDAIESGQLVLHYQPQIDLHSGSVACVEAMVSWQHPDLGNIAPSRLMPLAEDTGQIAAIGIWAMQQACRQNKAWQELGLPSVCVSLKVSAKQVALAGLEDQVAQCLAASGLEPNQLELELSESAAMHDLVRTAKLMNNLKRVGVQLAIGGFGIGHSNLRTLAGLPVDKLKLDGSIVKDITSDPDSLAVARIIFSLARQMDWKSAAETVETQGQVALLAQCHCDLAQGYYFSHPLQAAELELMLQHKNLSTPTWNARDRLVRTLLVLDDDPGITRAVKRALRFDGYRVLLANRAHDAFELLACNDIGVVLCDQRLQETTGVEMLITIKRLYPQTVRLLFSGYKDFDAMGEAINKGAVYKFLSKPFDSRDLRRVLMDAFDVYEGSIQRTASEGDADQRTPVPREPLVDDSPGEM